MSLLLALKNTSRAALSYLEKGTCLIRKIVLPLFALALTATQLSATEVASGEVLNAAVEPAMVGAPEPHGTPEMNLTKIQIQDRADSEEVVAQLPERGSFLWIVGAIVVAGVILAVLL